MVFPGFRPRVYILYLVVSHWHEGGGGAGIFLLAAMEAADLTTGAPPLFGVCFQPPLNLLAVVTFCSQVHHTVVGARITISTLPGS